jgi:putative sporulation protein YyaC
MVIRCKEEKQKEDVIFLCIGSDRSTGDSLGPLIGYKLELEQEFDLEILGTLQMPVHAVNLEQALMKLEEDYQDCVVVAIDASIGKREHVGWITLSEGPIRPGLGVSKQLGTVGDISITGIVGWGLKMEPLLLQNIRLSLVMRMADCISQGIYYSQPYIQARFVDNFSGFSSRV